MKKKSLSAPSLLSLIDSSSSSALMSTFRGKNKPIPDIPYMSTTVTVGDVDCCLHTYDPERTFGGATPPKALVVFLHGFNAHGTFPTTKIVADVMLKNGYAFMAPDLPGHGMSSGFSGLRGFIESKEKLIDVASSVIDYAYRDYLTKVSAQKARSDTVGSPGLQMFVIGSSLGGNLSLQASLRNNDISGVILMAPMLRIKLLMPNITPKVLRFFANMMPRAPAIPVIKKKNYRCPKILSEVDNDILKPHQHYDLARIGSAESLFDLADSLKDQFEKVTCPCFVMVAEEDTTVDNQGALELKQKAKSTDMTLRRYPALHGLMGEPSPLLDKMQIDMITWLDERCEDDSDSSSSSKKNANIRSKL